MASKELALGAEPLFPNIEDPRERSSIAVVEEDDRDDGKSLVCEGLVEDIMLGCAI